MLLLTDDTGMLQHAAGATPNLYYGYCTDDNARALIAAVKLAHLRRRAVASGPTGSAASEDVLVLAQRYLAFLGYALNPETRRFRNFMSYDRTWVEETGSEDSHARAVWAVGTAAHLGPNAHVQEMADQLMRKVLPATEEFHHVRSCAYSLLGIDEYLRSGGDHEPARRLKRALAERLFETYCATRPRTGRGGKTA